MLAVLVAMFAGPSAAQQDYGLAVHVSAPDYGLGCDLFDDVAMTCDAVVEEGTAATSWVWVAFYGYDNVTASIGIGAIQFGIDFGAGLTVAAFTLCTGGSVIGTNDQQGYPNWPTESGSAAAITWAGGCYTNGSEEKFCKVGYFFMVPGGSGMFSIAGDPRIENRVDGADCDAQVFTVPAGGWSSADVFGDDPADGFKACAPVPVETTSWGRIKSLY